MSEIKLMRLIAWLIGLGGFVYIALEHWKSYFSPWNTIVPYGFGNKGYDSFCGIIDIIFIAGFLTLIIFEFTIWKNR